MEKILYREAPTITIDIFIAGHLNMAKEVCREYVECGLCVTVTSTAYIYTGGEEAGIRVGLINYPRFPTDRLALLHHAEKLGMMLMERLDQQSFSIVGPETTHWFSRREADLS